MRKRSSPPRRSRASTRTSRTRRGWRSWPRPFATRGGFAVGALSTAGDSTHPLLLGLAFATEPGRAWYVPIGHAPRLDSPSEQLSLDAIREALGPLLADASLPKTAYGAKYLLHQLGRAGMPLQGVTREASLMGFLLGETSQALANLVNERLGVELRPVTALTGTGRKAIPLAQVDPEAAGELACQEVDLLLQVVPGLEAQLRERGQWELYEEMELPLMPVLAEMEAAGSGDRYGRAAGRFRTGSSATSRRRRRRSTSTSGTSSTSAARSSSAMCSSGSWGCRPRGERSRATARISGRWRGCASLTRSSTPSSSTGS